MSSEKVDITQEELKRFEEAMKKEEFRKLLCEYAEEISSPENRKKYEEEIAQLENERGMDIKFINPEPGHVLKSTLNNDEKKKKAFINICKNDNIGKATSTKESSPNGCGTHWSIPHSLTRPRDELDKNGQKCTVYDVVFHPDTYRMAKSTPRFKKLVHDTALDAIEQHFNVSLDKQNIKTPKIKNNYKGSITSTVIRTRRDGQTSESEGLPQESVINQMPYPYDSNKTTKEVTTEWLEKEGRRKSPRSAEKGQSKKSSTPVPSSSSSSLKEGSSSASQSTENSSSTEDKPITPKYTILHRSAIDLQEFRNAPDAKTSTRPKELVISIDLPKLKSANTVDLDIVENYIMLKCTTPAPYELELRLPYPVDETNGTAKFDKSKSQLNVTLPVLAAPPPEPLFCSAPAEEDASSDVDSERGTSMDDGSEVSYDSISMKVDKECEDLNSDDAIMKSPSDSDTCSMLVSAALCQLPPFVFSQDHKTVTFVMDVSNINPNSIVQKYDQSNTYDLVFVSEGSGCFPIHYRLYIQFPEGCNLSPDEDVLDRSAENLVALLYKDEKCQEMWDGFLVGFDENNLEYLRFESLGHLEKSLEELEECCDPVCTMPQAHDTDYHLDVTELDEKHVTLDVQVTRGVTESDTTDTESHVYPHIEVIHRKRTPGLHGILKQRSRTISDSSDENGTILSASPDSSSGDGHFPSVKKSVSFNEKIDQATFKPNSTITSMHNSLKSKRKRTRQREERRKNGRRRRRHSSQESSEGEDLKEKSGSSATKGSHKGQGKNSRKKAAATSGKSSAKQDGAGSSSTVEETDETTNTEGSDRDSDSGYDNTDSSTRNSSVPESSPQSKNDDADHYNLRPRGNGGSKSEPKNNHGTKNCSHTIVVGNERTDNELTSEERTKLDRIMTTALNQTLSQIKPVTDSESLEVSDSPEADTVGPSKGHVVDTMAHMASLSIGDAGQIGSIQNSIEKDVVVSSKLVHNGNLGDIDNNNSLPDQEKSLEDEKNIVNGKKDGSCGVGDRVNGEAPVHDSKDSVLSRAKNPKDESSGGDKKLKNNVDGETGQKSELDNFRPPKIESVLSWADTEYSNHLSNEHHTQCAFHFNNNVMFELD